MGFGLNQYNLQTVMLVILVVFYNGSSLNSARINVNTAKPKLLNIGVLLSFNSTIGKVAKVAIEAAVQDVNKDQSVFGGVKLNLTMQDSNNGGYLDTVEEALSMMENEVVAIIGPQFSSTAHVISQIAEEIQVPLLSFATDPTLTSLQYPFFVRTTQNDIFQMAAIADIISYYKWISVVAIYVDDDYGRNGVAALREKLDEKDCKITYMAPLSPKGNRSSEITNVMVKVASTESKIIVLLAYSDWALQVLDKAIALNMMGAGYAWIATDWLSTVIDTYSPPSQEMNDIQGVLTLRMHTPESQRKRKFASRWSNFPTGKEFRLNTYGLYAYDTVWLLAYAIVEFLNHRGNISFSYNPRIAEVQGNSTLHASKVFNEGNLLLQSILQVNFTGLTGSMAFSNKNLVNPSYDVINVVGFGCKRIGFWSNYSGLSVVPPEKLRSGANQHLSNVVWPGLLSQKPHGWVFPSDGRVLRIGVRYRVGFTEFVSRNGTNFTGFCIDVFHEVLNSLPYKVPYKFIPVEVGGGHKIINGNVLLKLVSSHVYDSAVGEISITTEGTRVVDFTQPYIESGLVVVTLTPVKKLNTNPWTLLRPFTPMLWLVTTIFFLGAGVLIWLLEHKINDDFRGSPRKQVVTILLFSFSPLVNAQKEKIKGYLSRLVLIIWLFVVLVINSCYTANLTSILTVEQLSSPITGIESLIAGNQPIGYRYDSNAGDYLTHAYNIDRSRLVPLNSEQAYTKALKDGPKKGGVAAIVDQRPYMEIFLSSHCEFSMVGQKFGKTGWGFAFQRGSQLGADFSAAIIKLSEQGVLQKIHDKWFSVQACTSKDENENETENRLDVGNFWGLFLISGIACLLALIFHLIQLVRKFRNYSKELDEGRSLRPNRSTYAHFQTFLSFLDEKEKNVKSMFK